MRASVSLSLQEYTTTGQIWFGFVIRGKNNHFDLINGPRHSILMKSVPMMTDIGPRRLQESNFISIKLRQSGPAVLCSESHVIVIAITQHNTLSRSLQVIHGVWLLKYNPGV